jgi:hypothetical protein
VDESDRELLVVGKFVLGRWQAAAASLILGGSR